LILETSIKNSNTIVIDLDIGSRIVTFKLRRDVVRKLDILVRKHGLGTRSNALRKICEAFVRALEEVNEGSVINNISIRVNYRDNNGSEKTVDVVLK